MSVTCACYIMIVTIKQVIIGAVIGSSVVGIMVQRMRSEKNLHAQDRQIASSKINLPGSNTHALEAISKPKGHKKHGHTMESEPSSRKLVG
jgi:hypothetical protein